MSAIDRQFEGYGLTGLGQALVTYVCSVCHELAGEIRLSLDGEALFIKRGEHRSGQSPSLALSLLPDLDIHFSGVDFLACRRHGFGMRNSVQMVRDLEKARASKAITIEVTMSSDSPGEQAAVPGLDIR